MAFYVSNTTEKDIFYDFCGGIPFWDQGQIDQDTPRFSPCFLNTVLVWAPCAFLWFTAPLFAWYMKSSRKFKPLPFSVLNVSKAVVAMVLAVLVVLRLIFQENDGYACSGDTNIPTSGYVAVAVQFVTFLFAIVMGQLQRYRGLKTSGIPLLFWVFTVGSEGVSLYTHITSETVCAEDVVYYVYVAVLLVQVILHCFVETHAQTGYTNLDDEKPCPEEETSVLGHILYSWLTPDVWNAYRKKFTIASFWEQTPKLHSEVLGPMLIKAWVEETDRCQREKSLKKAAAQPEIDLTFRHTNGKPLSEDTPLYYGRRKRHESKEDNSNRPNLYWTLARVFWPFWMEAVGYQFITQMLWMVQPILIRLIIDMIENKNTTTEPMWKAYLYAVMLFTLYEINSLLFHSSFHHMLTLGLKVKSALICLIYQKALTMKRSTNTSTTVGEVVNLMSVDCQRIQDAFIFSYYSVVLWFLMAFAFYELWDLMGVASLGWLIVMMIVLPVMGVIAFRQYLLQKELLALKGVRTRILNEIIGGIKVLKMYAWEPSFIKKVQDIRALEIRCLWKYAIYTANSVMLAITNPFMMNFVLVLIYVLTSPTHSLNAEQAFTALSILNIMRFPVALMPFLVNGGVQAYVSIGRIQKLLWTEDVNPDNVQYVTNLDCAVKIQKADFTWNLELPIPTLQNIDLQVREGELVAVVGHVGCGKSSLISAILGDMEKPKGSVTVKGSLAYVPQEAWIQNMTLRDNILFGKPYQERKYRRILNSCALLPDLQILAGGDMTEIGEKGINISGGQKQRVSLARAVYNNADIYLLDDPLSAVDSHVGKQLFKTVIGNEGLLRHKTRILVTHGIHWLPMVDRIVVLDDGRVSEIGSYDVLVEHNGPFAQFLQTYLAEAADEDDLDEELRTMKDQLIEKIDTLTSDGGAISDDSVSLKPRKRTISRGMSVTGKMRRNSRTGSVSFAAEDFSRLTLDETSEEGAIKLRVLVEYMKAMGIAATAFVFVTMAIFQGLNVYSNFWLTYWTEDPILKNVSLASTQEYEDKYIYYILIYLLLGVIQGVSVFISFYLALTRMVQASAKLHNKMLNCILRSPMSFFDTTPIGRIVNRFSSDIDIMDNKLPESFRLWSIMMFSTAAIIIVVSVITPIFIVVLVPMCIIYVFIAKFYLPTARQMRRIESICRSPIYNHFSETITGASVIRAYRCGERFIHESRKRVDKNIKFFFAANTGSRWIGIRLEFLGNLIVLCGTMFALVSDDINGAEVGLSINYILQITIALNLGVFAISEMEMNVVSAERVEEYTTLSPEAPWAADFRTPDPDWPRKGTVDFLDYTTRYRAGLDLVLRGINCRINDGEKVGIVGRTGAGKSSLTLSLFRLIESAGGAIMIDGVNIADLGLHDLRTKITILPQDPVLFSGSLRMNLDPFDRFTSPSIWKAITCAHLKEFVQGLEGELEYECGEGGGNLSVGQRQLVCLARTLLHKTKILILDEATAAVDMETDDLIQDTIRTEFNQCTIITIAHRLNTIMDYDRVMVLDQGLIKEFDAPDTLLQDTSGVFYGMAKDAGLV